MLSNVGAAVRMRNACVIRARFQAGRRFMGDGVKKPSQPTTTVERAPDKQQLSIPGPSWLWTTVQPAVQPLAVPFRMYGQASKDRPYITQFCSALVIYFLGDLASQYIAQRGEHPEAPGQALIENYDTQRPLRALVIGGVSSIPSYRWFIFLSTNFNAPVRWPMSRALSLVYKVAISQVFFAPLFNSYFFGMHCILSGEGGPAKPESVSSLWEFAALQSRFGAAWARIVDTVPTSWYNSCFFWPFVTAFSFTFIPIRHRSVFAGCAAIGWQSYLGIVNQRAVEQERTEISRQAMKM